MNDKSAVKDECYTIIWRNPKVTDWVNLNFPGEWEKDIAFTVLAFAAEIDPVVAEKLGADRG